jgi:heterodisulfide reductase subunit B
MTKYGLFLGCIVPNRYPGIESSARLVLKELNIEFVDLEETSCCPAPGVFRSFDQRAWFTIAARNLALAEAQELDIITFCNGCFGTLFEAAHFLSLDKKLCEGVNKTLAEIGMEYKGKVKVRHFPELLYREVGKERITAKVKNKLKLKVATFYGCHFLKPSKIVQIDNPERPVILDELVEATGAISIRYRNKLTCCGAGGGIRARMPEVAQRMTEGILENVKNAGGDCIVDVCPFCHLQLDLGQKDTAYRIPILHLSQFLGLALGVDKHKLGLQYNATPVGF